jgi:fructose/tagatose bisphosphate aldolase
MNKVNIIDVMNDANKTGWALAAFNIPSFDAMRAVMTASKDNGTPVIVQLSSKIVEHYGAKVLKSWFDTIQNHLKSVCFIHLDHCRDEKILRDCINSRWDMVMFDGSDLNIEENIKFTEKYVKIAHKLNVAVEGEIGVLEAKKII